MAISAVFLTTARDHNTLPVLSFRMIIYTDQRLTNPNRVQAVFYRSKYVFLREYKCVSTDIKHVSLCAFLN